MKNESKMQEIIIGIGILIILVASINFFRTTYVSEPIFSVKGGFYNEEFELELGCLNPNLKIYYTVDGSMPDQNAMEYSAPIMIYDYSVNENVYPELFTAMP